MDTYSESKRYNDHMRTCKNILNKMKLLLNFTELPSETLDQTHESLKELNSITNDLLDLKDEHNINTVPVSVEEKQKDENNELNSETRNATQKSKFSLHKIKPESNKNMTEKEDKTPNRESNWEPDSLPYNASFMSLALNANELEGVESKVSNICDSLSQSYEEKYKILRSVFFKEQVSNLNINNTCTCFSPICWTKNLNCNKKDSLTVISNDSKHKPFSKKKFTFGPTNFISMQATVSAKDDDDEDSYDDDDSEKSYKDVSVNTKRIKYRQISSKRLGKTNSCDSQCPYQASVESLPFEFIEYEVSQKHFVAKNIPKKIKELTRSSINKLLDKRDGKRKNDNYPYEPSMSSLPNVNKNKDTKSENNDSEEEDNHSDSISSDEDNELSNNEVQTEGQFEACNEKTCDYEDSDEESESESESDESVESLISISKDEEDKISEVNDDESSELNTSFIYIENEDVTEQVKCPKDIGKIYESVEECEDERCLKYKNKDKPKQRTVQEDKKVAKKGICPSEPGSLYQGKLTECPASKCIKKDKIKKCNKLTPEIVQSEKITEEKKPECPVDKCKRKYQINDKPKPQIIQVDEETKEEENDEDMYEKAEEETPVEEMKDVIKKSYAKNSFGTECPAKKCKKRYQTNDIPKPQIIQVDEEMIQEEKECPTKKCKRKYKTNNIPKPQIIQVDEEMIQEEKECSTKKCKRKYQVNDKPKSQSMQIDKEVTEEEKDEDMNEKPEEETQLEVMKDDNKKSFAKYPIETECPNKKCKWKCEINGKPKPQVDEEMAEEENDEEINENPEKETPVEEMKDDSRKSFVKYPIETECPNKKINDEPKPQTTQIDEEIVEEKEEGIDDETEKETPVEEMDDVRRKSSEKCPTKIKLQQRGKCPEDTGNLFEREFDKCPAETSTKKDKKLTEDKIMTEECPVEIYRKNKIQRLNKSKPQIILENEKITEDENVAVAEDEKITNEEKEEVADDETEKTPPEEEIKDIRRKSSTKYPTHIAKLKKIDKTRCQVEECRNRGKTSVDKIKKTEEPEVIETDKARRISTASNTDPMPIIQNQATSTAEEGVKIKDMHAWALAYVKLEDDGAKLVQILHTTPYEPGRYIIKEPNELILFGPQAGSSRLSK